VNAPLGTGPLRGLRVIEMAALGPTPFAAMVMADMGAEVVRIDRPDAARSAAPPPNMGRGRRSVALDLKRPEATETLLEMIDEADVLVEGFRPGVMERLGLGPHVCLDRNRELVYGRMTGWGQAGPLAEVAGHDINYISIAGVLGAIGGAAGPVVPLNVVGDFGGGGMLLLVGVLMALFERSRSGRGQVVDAAMVDGASLLATLIHEFISNGSWSTARPGANLLDGGAPHYSVYETADGGHVAVGALEPQFFEELIRTLGIDFDCAAQNDPASWPALRASLEDAFRHKTRDEWTRLFDSADACVTPVLRLDEAPGHPQALSRRSYVRVDGRVEPGPAPLFSRTPGRVRGGSSYPGADTSSVLREWGVASERVRELLQKGAAVERLKPDREPQGAS
jgi:alpha-methylacyl-CoA racemase